MFRCSSATVELHRAIKKIYSPKRIDLNFSIIIGYYVSSLVHCLSPCPISHSCDVAAGVRSHVSRIHQFLSLFSAGYLVSSHRRRCIRSAAGSVRTLSLSFCHTTTISPNRPFKCLCRLSLTRHHYQFLSTRLDFFDTNKKKIKGTTSKHGCACLTTRSKNNVQSTIPKNGAFSKTFGRRKNKISFPICTHCVCLDIAFCSAISAKSSSH